MEADLFDLFTNFGGGDEGASVQLQRSHAELWICWYKKTSNKPTELVESKIRDAALALDLVDVKACAAGQEW